MSTDAENGKAPLEDHTNGLSNGEKTGDLDMTGQIEAALAHDELPPDPDAGLSEEERAKIVCVHASDPFDAL